LDKRVSLLESNLQKWQGIIFPSSPAVKWFMEALMSSQDVRSLAGKQLLAVGPLTAKTLAGYGLKADAVPSGFGGAAALAKEPNLKPGLYGYVCSDVSPVEARASAFEGTGVTLDPFTFYKNETVTHPRYPSQDISRVLFTSSSTVNAYFSQFPDEKSAQRTWLAVGSSTLKVLTSLGLRGYIIS
jgi:uroporphyrinogen-III synthase